MWKRFWLWWDTLGVTQAPPAPALFRARYEHDFERQDRVEATENAGFHRGARGTVAFVQPNGVDDDLIWVDRDGAGSAVWYHPSELKKIVPLINEERNRPLSYAQPTRPSI